MITASFFFCFIFSFFFSSCTKEDMKCLILRTEVLFWSLCLQSIFMQIKIILKVLQCCAETPCCVSWQHGCFRFLLLVLEIVSAVAKLFLVATALDKRGNERLKKMGVVTKTSLTCMRVGYLMFGEQGLILFYLFILQRRLMQLWEKGYGP